MQSTITPGGDAGNTAPGGGSPRTLDGLGDVPIWFGWKPIPKRKSDGETVFAKVPFSPHDGRAGSSTDPTKWGTLDEARTAVARFGLAGLAIALTTLPDGTRLAGLDADACITTDPHSLQPVAPWARPVHALLDGHLNELSPSGTGRHHLFLVEPDRLPEGSGDRVDYSHGRKPARYGFELYLSEGRYFTVTDVDRRGELRMLGPQTIVQLVGELEKFAPKVGEPKGRQKSLTWETDHDKAIEILDYLPNAGGFADYMSWFTIVGSVHNATYGAPAGLHAVERWTVSGGYDTAACSTLWNYFDRRPPRVTIAHLINQARDHGCEPYPPYVSGHAPRDGTTSLDKFILDAMARDCSDRRIQPTGTHWEAFRERVWQAWIGQRDAPERGAPDRAGFDRVWDATGAKWEGAVREAAIEMERNGDGTGGDGAGGDAGAGDQSAPDDEMRPPPYTDETLALRFADRHANDLRYVAARGQWLCWKGTRWEPDDTLQAFDLARRICRESSITANKRRDAAAVASAKTVAAVERLAKADRRHAATVEQWDGDPWLLNTPGGTIDLRTGHMRPHDPADHLTKMTAVAPGGDCPVWHAFLKKVTAGDDDLKAFIQRMLGYSLTGTTSAHALFFGYGTGANGKSVLVETASGILGDYHRTASMETFTVSSTDRHPTELAMLRGARLVTATETEEGRRWAESKIKTLTGGDKITARFMRQDFFEFTPQFKLVITGNHKPGLKSVDEAIRRRFHLIPFNVTIPVKDRDANLRDTLKAEWPGILKWMIEGCQNWQRDGLKPPPAVREATAAYLEAEDLMLSWLDDCCKQGARDWASSSDLFASWKGWTERMGEVTGSAKSFGMKLGDRGFKPGKQDDRRGFGGISLIPPPARSGTDEADNFG